MPESVTVSRPNYEIPEDVLEDKVRSIRGDRPIHAGLGGLVGVPVGALEGMMIAGPKHTGKGAALGALVGGGLGAGTVALGSLFEEYMTKRELRRRGLKKKASVSGRYAMEVVQAAFLDELSKL